MKEYKLSFILDGSYYSHELNKNEINGWIEAAVITRVLAEIDGNYFHIDLLLFDSFISNLLNDND